MIGNSEGERRRGGEGGVTDLHDGVAVDHGGEAEGCERVLHDGVDGVWELCGLLACFTCLLGYGFPLSLSRSGGGQRLRLLYKIFPIAVERYPWPGARLEHGPSGTGSCGQKRAEPGPWLSALSTCGRGRVRPYATTLLLYYIGMTLFPPFFFLIRAE